MQGEGIPQAGSCRSDGARSFSVENDNAEIYFCNYVINMMI